jgi:hypothetical protein
MRRILTTRFIFCLRQELHNPIRELNPNGHTATHVVNDDLDVIDRGASMREAAKHPRRTITLEIFGRIDKPPAVLIQYHFAVLAIVLPDAPASERRRDDRSCGVFSQRCFCREAPKQRLYERGPHLGRPEPSICYHGPGDARYLVG